MDRLKLYALNCRNTDPLELPLLIEDTHKVNSISKVEEVTKLEAWTTYNSICQGPYESIITFKERFNSAHEAYVVQDNPKVDVCNSPRYSR